MAAARWNEQFTILLFGLKNIGFRVQRFVTVWSEVCYIMKQPFKENTTSVQSSALSHIAPHSRFNRMNEQEENDACALHLNARDNKYLPMHLNSKNTNISSHRLWFMNEFRAMGKRMQRPLESMSCLSTIPVTGINSNQLLCGWCVQHRAFSFYLQIKRNSPKRIRFTVISVDFSDKLCSNQEKKLQKKRKICYERSENRNFVFVDFGVAFWNVISKEIKLFQWDGRSQRE